MAQRTTTESHPGVIESLRRYPFMSLVIIIVMMGLSIGAALLTAPKAQASASIALATPPQSSVLAPGVTGDASLARYTAQRAGFVTSDAVLENVAKRLNRTDITELRRDISASPSSDSNTIVITASADSADEAVELADATIAAYREESAASTERLTNEAVASLAESQRQVEASAAGGGPALLNAAATSVSQLQLEASQIRSSSAVFGDGVQFVKAPRADAVTLPSLPIREAALGFVVGLVIAATVAWIRADRALSRR